MPAPPFLKMQEGQIVDFSNIKRAVTWTSAAIAVVAVVVFWGTNAYRMATGGDVVCDPYGHCYDRYCLLFWLGFQLVISFLVAGCLYYCETLALEERKTCRIQCLVLFIAWSVVTIVMTEFLCTRLPP
jgi:hypothetical protein